MAERAADTQAVEDAGTAVRFADSCMQSDTDYFQPGGGEKSEQRSGTNDLGRIEVPHTEEP